MKGILVIFVTNNWFFINFISLQRPMRKKESRDYFQLGKGDLGSSIV